MFRNDLGDDESDEGSFEWDHERQVGAQDQAKDDSVVIMITETGDLHVGYEVVE